MKDSHVNSLPSQVRSSSADAPTALHPCTYVNCGPTVRGFFGFGFQGEGVEEFIGQVPQ